MNDLFAKELIEKIGIGGRITNVYDNGNTITCNLVESNIRTSLTLELIKDVKEKLRDVVENKTFGYKLISSDLLSEVTGYDENLLESARYSEYSPLIVNIIEVELENIIDSLDEDGALKVLNNYFYGNFKDVFEVDDKKYFIFTI